MYGGIVSVDRLIMHRREWVVALQYLVHIPE